MTKRWLFADAEPALHQTLARQLPVPTAIAQVLVNRGYREAATAEAFLNPQLRQLGDPFELPDMTPAVERILAAIQLRECIVIYGDYDVDGLTSSALLVRVLCAAGATVKNFLPHRLDEGYGLSPDGLTRCLKECEPRLIIAVDCGTSSAIEITGLKRDGIDCIVVDHHTPPAQLPDCIAVINPKRERQRRPWSDLASVGLAFRLARGLLKRDPKLADTIDLREHLDLVAIGTVADIVPLTGENRILVKAGLERLPATTKPGLRSLMEIAHVAGAVNPYHIGFRIGPRLNAAGRLADAMAALELLLTEDSARAMELAKSLDAHNAERQRVEERIVEEAIAMARGFAADRVLVLANDGWHVGVIGIVASRVLQQFYRPTVVIGLGEGLGKGSCRSIAGFSIVEALQTCAPMLEKFGGHEMAAGLSIRPGNIDGFRRALNLHAASVLREEDLSPRLCIDAVVRLNELDHEFFEALKRLEPCGPENPSPLFAAQDLRLKGPPRIVGKNHLKFDVTDGDTTIEAVWWGMAGVELPTSAFELAFSPEINEYRGVENVQLRIKDVRTEKS
jgi:single-stranded-DNA-specific exonuclease